MVFKTLVGEHESRGISLQKLGSVKANGREPKSCLGQVFIFKLGCLDMCTIALPIQVQPNLEWRTQPKFCPVSLSLSMQKPWVPEHSFERCQDPPSSTWQRKHVGSLL
jgi:hypothetical protein